MVSNECTLTVGSDEVDEDLLPLPPLSSQAGETNAEQCFDPLTLRLSTIIPTSKPSLKPSSQPSSVPSAAPSDKCLCLMNMR